MAKFLSGEYNLPHEGLFHAATLTFKTLIDLSIGGILPGSLRDRSGSRLAHYLQLFFLGAATAPAPGPVAAEEDRGKEKQFGQ